MTMRNWIRRLHGKEIPTPSTEETPPALLQADTFEDHDIGEFRWNPEHNRHLLTVTNNGQTIEWKPRQGSEKNNPPAWVPTSTCLHLHIGCFRWDFKVDEMAFSQIGVGFMSLWDIGPDWGFFGY